MIGGALGVIEAAEARQTALPGLEADAAAADAAIHEAAAAGRYATLADLGATAGAAAQALADARSAQQADLDVLAGLLRSGAVGLLGAPADEGAGDATVEEGLVGDETDVPARASWPSEAVGMSEQEHPATGQLPEPAIGEASGDAPREAAQTRAPDGADQAGARDGSAVAEAVLAAVDQVATPATVGQDEARSTETSLGAEAQAVEVLGEPTAPGPAPVAPGADAALSGARDETEGLPDLAGKGEGGSDHLELAAIRPSILARLVERDLLGIAADAAGAIEVSGRRWPISSAVLRAVAAARSPQRDYGQDTVRFTTLVDRAMGEAGGDLDSVTLLGGLLRPAMLQTPPIFRASIETLARGRLGQHLLETAEAIAELHYDFPPEPDELARLAGAVKAPRRQRLAEKLGVWCDTTAKRTSRWQFASLFMRHVASDEGPVGAARRAIEAGAPDALEKAKIAIDKLDTSAKIEAQSEEFRALIGRNSDRLYPKGVDYLTHHFSEALAYLHDWVRATETASQASARGEARLRTTVGNLSSRLDKAARQLRDEAEAGRLEGRMLESALAEWLADRCEEARVALAGGEVATDPTLEEALTGRRDLLPTELRQLAETQDPDWRPLVAYLVDADVPDPAEAFDTARRDGAFDVAARIAQRFGLPVDGPAFAEEVRGFVVIRVREVEQHQRRLKALAKVDYAHQDEIGRRLHWCALTLVRLAGVEGAEADLSDIPVQVRELDGVADEIERKIRSDQVGRIGLHRTEKNAEEVDALLRALGALSAQAIEDRIAQLRDGRSAAIFQSDAGHLVAQFTPGFVTAASGPDWPKTLADYRAAFAADGVLHTEEDRRAAAGELIESYRAISSLGGDTQPSLQRVRSFLELIGFDRVAIGVSSRVSGARAWKIRINAQISSDGWFLPPIFGSKASSGYDLLLIGPDVLPEAIQSALDPKMPSILVISGIADFARRREYAERLRGSSIAALLIDEALVAFAATRRDTRARTIFECALPFGRVEPYTTDAGQIPPEMFFGRRAEIAKIMSKTADGCLVYGGRQLGKSALLHHVAKVNHAPAEDRIVVRREVKPLGKAEPASSIWQHLADMLSSDGVVRPQSRTADEVVRDIRGWLVRKPHGQIICLFDETDHFMAAETEKEYPQLSRLKELMEDTGRAFKVVFAGLHNVQRMYVQPNSPLAHLDQHDDDVDEILAWANYYPSLVQEFLKGLLATLNGVGSGKPYRLGGDGPLWRIPSAELFDHPGFQQVETRVRDKFHLTLDLDPRYALVAYTLAWLNADGDEEGALVTGFRPEELLLQAMTFWPKTAEVPSRPAFEALLEEMFDLGVLGRVRIAGTSKRYRYCLASRQVAAMLGSKDDVLETLEEIENRDPSVSYDRTIYRRPYASIPGHEVRSSGPYSPLTDHQIEHVVGEGGSSVRIVCGLGVLGLDKVGVALKRIADAGMLLGAPKQRPRVTVEEPESDRELRQAVTRTVATEELRLVCYKPSSGRSAQQALEWLERRHEVLSGAIRPVLLLDAADRDMREMAIRRARAPEEGIWLAAWGSEMLRVLLNNLESNLDTKAFRTAVLKATGGVPSDTIQLVREVIQSGDETAITRWKPPARNVTEVGAGPVGIALKIIDEARRREDYLAMDELVLGEAGVDLLSIGPDLVAMGLISGWNHSAHTIRRSALGTLIADRMGGR